jgi:hypothetical protein
MTNASIVPKAWGLTGKSGKELIQEIIGSLA